MEFLVFLHPVPSASFCFTFGHFLSTYSFPSWFFSECRGPWVCCWGGEALFSDWCCQRLWGQIWSWEGQGRQGKWQRSLPAPSNSDHVGLTNNTLKVDVCFSCGKMRQWSHGGSIMRMAPTQLPQQVLWCHCWGPHPELKGVYLKETKTLKLWIRNP